MNHTVEGLYPLLQAKLEGNVVALASWGGAIALGVAVVFVMSLMGGTKMPGLPIALADELPNAKDRINRWTNDTRNLLNYGYEKVRGAGTTPGARYFVPHPEQNGL